MLTEQTVPMEKSTVSFFDEQKVLDLRNFPMGNEVINQDWEYLGQNPERSYLRHIEKVHLYGSDFAVPMLARKTEPDPEFVKGRKSLTLIVIGGGSSTDLGNSSFAEMIATAYAENPGFYIENLIVLPNIPGVPWSAEKGTDKIGTDTYFPNANVLLKALKQTAEHVEDFGFSPFNMAEKHIVVTGFSNGALLGMHLAVLLEREAMYGQDSEVNVAWDRPTGSKLHLLHQDLSRLDANLNQDTDFHFSDMPEKKQTIQLMPQTVDICLLESAGLIDQDPKKVLFWFMLEVLAHVGQFNVKKLWEKARIAWVTPEGIPRGSFFHSIRQMFDTSDNRKIAAELGIPKLGDTQPLLKSIASERTSRIAREDIKGKSVVLSVLGARVVPIIRDLQKKTQNLALDEDTLVTILKKRIDKLFLNVSPSFIAYGSLENPGMHGDVMSDPGIVREVVKVHIRELFNQTID